MNFLVEFNNCQDKKAYLSKYLGNNHNQSLLIKFLLDKFLLRVFLFDDIDFHISIVMLIFLYLSGDENFKYKYTFEEVDNGPNGDYLIFDNVGYSKYTNIGIFSSIKIVFLKNLSEYPKQRIIKKIEKNIIDVSKSLFS